MKLIIRKVVSFKDKFYLIFSTVDVQLFCRHETRFTKRYLKDKCFNYQIRHLILRSHFPILGLKVFLHPLLPSGEGYLLLSISLMSSALFSLPYQGNIISNSFFKSLISISILNLHCVNLNAESQLCKSQCFSLSCIRHHDKHYIFQSLVAVKQFLTSLSCNEKTVLQTKMSSPSLKNVTFTTKNVMYLPKHVIFMLVFDSVLKPSLEHKHRLNSHMYLWFNNRTRQCRKLTGCMNVCQDSSQTSSQTQGCVGVYTRGYSSFKVE